MTLNLVVVGHISQDVIVDSKGRIHEELGGTAAYSSLTAAKLGAQAGIVSKVGGDFKTRYHELLSDHGVDVAGLTVTGEKTTAFKNSYDAEDRRTQTLLALAPAIGFPDVPSHYLGARCFHFGPIFREIDRDIVRQAHDAGALTSLDPQGFLRCVDEAGRVRPSRWEDARGVLPFVDIYRSDEDEARLITGEKDPVKSARTISKMGPRIVLITRERKGSIVLDESEATKVPLVLADRFADSTGAGDIYVAGFIVEYLLTRDAVRAATFGACAASFKVEGVGVSALPTGNMVEARLRASCLNRSINRS